ncbi:hypothetical protein AVEN_108354-1 [Araneus ventricosus]|uniref:Reverse transcriptase RNase H-like domain-containing protein n=1 Tax=Araneus ventricosus TaxID=182803 RepID=A0A4Y2CV86_ARAVE|nr:hypothetical protein AVEN_108354-1 [Araneus ventricosus]
MEQHISELLKQNQELILALQRTHGSSQKVTVQFEKFDEENENFGRFFERFQTYLDVQNIPADNRAKVLVHFDPELPLTLASDASPVGVGCVLSHIYPDGSERPIAFASKPLSKTEQKYSQIDKEALAIVWAVKKFHLYLKGRRFTLVTDHKPLVAIFGSKRGLPALTATRLNRSSLILYFIKLLTMEMQTFFPDCQKPQKNWR